jgi:hypothetical protein
MNGILRKLRTGSPCLDRFNRWRKFIADSSPRGFMRG